MGIGERERERERDSRLRVLAALVAIVVALLTLAMAAPAKAQANELVGVWSERETPGSAIFIESIHQWNAEVTYVHPSVSVVTEENQSLEGSSAQARRFKVSRTNTYIDHALTIKARNCGYTVEGRRIDVQLDVYDVNVPSDSKLRFGGCFFEWYLNGDTGTRWFGCSTASKNCSMAFWWRITYAGTDEVVPLPYAFGLYDLDTPGEMVGLHGNLYNPVYVQNDNCLKFTGDTIGGADWCSTGGQDQNTFYSGFITRSDNGFFCYWWQASIACGVFGGLYPAYPRDFVDVSKAGDGELHFEGDVASYDIKATWPYCPAELRPDVCRVTDTLDASLDAERASVKVTNASGTDVTGAFVATRSGQTWTVAARNASDAQGTFTITISAPIREGYAFDGYASDTEAGHEAYLIPNAATIYVDSSNYASATWKTSNTAYDRVSWGFLEVDVASANDSVSQLGANACYSLEGTVLAVYSDEECTQEVCRVVLDAEGKATTGRLRVGDYWVREIEPGPGFVHNEGTCGSHEVRGIETTLCEREDVPQSEALVGSVVSKHDLELMSEGLRHNPLWHAYRDFAEAAGA